MPTEGRDEHERRDVLGADVPGHAGDAALERPALHDDRRGGLAFHLALDAELAQGLDEGLDRAPRVGRPPDDAVLAGDEAADGGNEAERGGGLAAVQLLGGGAEGAALDGPDALVLDDADAELAQDADSRLRVLADEGVFDAAGALAQRGAHDRADGQALGRRDLDGAVNIALAESYSH
jgi:hypothetical protein